MWVRPARAADAQAIAEVHVAAWREAYAGIVPERLLAGLSIPDRTDRWRGLLGQPAPDTKTFVAEGGGEVVGFASCGRQGASALPFAGEFYAIYVLRRAQRRGLGRRLMGAMVEFLLARGMRSASLWVLRDNTPARRFYEAVGGTAVAEREDTWDGDHVLAEVAYGWSDLAEIPRAHR